MQKRSLVEVLNDPQLKMGHAFVLCALLNHQRGAMMPWGAPPPLELEGDGLEQLQAARTAAAAAEDQQHHQHVAATRAARQAKRTQPPHDSLDL